MKFKDKIRLIAPCDAIIVRTRKNFVSKAIRFFSRGKVNHVAMYIGGGSNDIIEYTGKTGDCRIVPLSKYFHKEYKIWVRRINGITVDQAEKMKAAAYADIGKNYDYLGFIQYIMDGIRRLLGIKFSRKRDSKIQAKDKRACNAGYDSWSKQGGNDLFPDIGDERATPEDLLQSNKMQTLFIIDFSEENSEV